MTIKQISLRRWGTGFIFSTGELERCQEATRMLPFWRISSRERRLKNLTFVNRLRLDNDGGFAVMDHVDGRGRPLGDFGFLGNIFSRRDLLGVKT